MSFDLEHQEPKLRVSTKPYYVTLAYTYLLFGCHARAHSLDAVPTLDDISLERDWARTSVQLKIKAAGITQECAELISPP